MSQAQLCAPLPHGKSLRWCRALRRDCTCYPGYGQCPTQNASAKGAKSSSPCLLPCKTAGKERASLKRTWNHCSCLLILYRGRSVVRSEGCVYPGLSIWAPSICPVVWWCIYNSLFSEVSRGVKSRCICEKGAEDWGTSVCAMAYPALQF